MKTNQYSLGANRMRRKIVKQIKEWWKEDETMLSQLLNRVGKIKLTDNAKKEKVK